VCPGQRKLRLRVVIEPPVLPVGRVVTTVAALAKSATVWIVVSVACETGVPGVVKRRGHVTLIAGHIGVRTDQWKTCKVVIEPQFCSPTGHVMTALALCAQLTHVCIVVTVTCVTVAAATILEIAAAMTILTVEPAVPVSQREAGYGQVIERNCRPRPRNMAIRALVTIASLVNVVVSMTCHASTADIAEIGFAMAARAGRENVRASQRKACRIVVEKDVAPGSRVVARTAVFAKSAAMRIVGTMTAYAFGFRVPARLAGIVAIAASSAYVPATQDKVGKFVVERLRIDLDDVHIPAFVFDVATRTLHASRIRKAAVHAGSVSQVSTDILVAHGTQVGLLPVG